MALKGGSYLVEQPPVFSSDGKFVLVCTGYTVSVLSVATGHRVAELQGHTDRVTSIIVVPVPASTKSALTHAWTSSLDGTIRLWNFISAKQIKALTVGRKIVSMVIPGLCKPTDGANPHLIAYLSVIWEKEKSEKKEEHIGEQKFQETREDRRYRRNVRGYNGRVIMHNLTTKKPIKAHLARTSSPRVLVASQSGSLIGMADNAKVWIWKVPGLVDSAFRVQATVLHPWKRLTVMTFDPTETMVAAGDCQGKIMIWNNVGERTFVSSGAFNDSKEVKKAPPEYDVMRGRVGDNDDAESCTTYHWHSHEVAFLSFTSDGAYLLSGGMEAVLVLWQVATGKRQFIPRLGAPLHYIVNSPDPAVFVISSADNALKFLNIGSMKMERVLEGIKPVVPCPERLEWLNVTRVTLEPRNGRIVLPTVNVSLQFYDVLRDRHAVEIQVSPRNFVSTFDQSRENFAQSTLVTHVAFAADASVMVTADLRVAEQGVGGGSFLKFWRKATGKLPYTLHTRVDEPHSGEVLALTYHPSEDVAVTCSHARDFKIWVQTRAREENNTVYSWRCSSAGSYKQKRMRAAAFSPDGSILAVAAEEYITLWNPKSNGLLCVLTSGAYEEAVALLSFVSTSQYLIAASYGERPRLTVWSLSTLSIWWSYYVEVEGIEVDPDTPCFAVLASRHSNHSQRRFSERDGDAYLCLFNPESPLPMSVWGFKDGVGGALQFLPKHFVSEEDIEANGTTPTNNRLIAFNKYREYILFDPYLKSDEKPAHKIEAKIPVDALSAYEAMYGALTEVSSEKKTKEQYEVAKIKARRPWGELLNGPSHVLPPLTKVGVHVLESFLQKQSK